MKRRNLLQGSRVIITGPNDGFITLTFKRLEGGLFRVSKSSFDGSGYYQAHLSSEIDVDWDKIEAEISASYDCIKLGIIKSVSIHN